MTHKELWVTCSFVPQTSPGPGPVLGALHLEQHLTPTCLSHNPVGTQQDGSQGHSIHKGSETLPGVEGGQAGGLGVGPGGTAEAGEGPGEPG